MTEIFCFLARAGFDFEVVDEVLIFPSGSVDESTSCFNVTINEDLLVEGDEMFDVVLNLDTVGSGLALGNSETAVTIIDVDCKFIGYGD